MSKTIKNLSEMDGRVYVYLRDAETQRMFLEDAASEGFTFCDGASPLDREASDFYAVNDDSTINFIGFVGRMAYQYGKEIGGIKIIKVDYREWINS